MKAPRLDGFINRYHREQYALDEKSKELLRKLYSLIDLIEPCGDDDKHILWLREERGTIEDYGNLDELIEDGMHSPMRKNGNLKTRLTCGKQLKAARVHEYICLSSEMKRATTCMCRQMNTAARNTVLDYIMH